MRLKTFHAESLAAAMELVRETLGPNAIIVATHEDDAARGARVTAAIDPEEQEFDFFSEGASEETLEFITEVLEQHGVPNELADRLLEAAQESTENKPSTALAHALDKVLTFDPLPDRAGGPPILVLGPPGVGKTVTCAKIAARVALADDESDTIVNLVAADGVRVGAVSQLAGYGESVGATLFEVQNDEELASLLMRLRRNELVVIDTPGTNPYNLDDLAHLVELCEAGRTDTVLVLNAGRDAREAAEIAEAFRPVGPKKLVTTGLDMARRLGSILAAADAGGMSLADVCLAPEIGRGLKPLSPEILARLLLPRASAESEDQNDEVGTDDTGMDGAVEEGVRAG